MSVASQTNMHWILNTDVLKFKPRLKVQIINLRYHELAKDIKHNKGGILRATVTYVKILKSDQLKKQRLEEICRLQQEQIGVLIDKIRVNITFYKPAWISVFIGCYHC